MTGSISLEGLEFFANHGFYEEEQKIGNKYSVDIKIEADFEKAAVSDKLEHTINYENLYQIIQQEILQRSRLLEHIAKRIIERVRQEFEHIGTVEVSVSKYNPPLGGICHKAKVTLID